MANKPNLPRLYELVTIDSVEDVLLSAEQLAEQGSEEGTLLWVLEQSDAKGKRGQTWFAPKGNLHFALILRPDMQAAKALELCCVAQVALYSALAGLVEPGMDIRFRWPNDLLVNGSKLATLNVAAKSNGQTWFDYLILAYSVNITEYPRKTPFPATSLLEEQGEVEFGAVELLESFARHFLSWANRWSDEGLRPVKRVWQNYLSEADVALDFGGGDSLISRVTLNDDVSVRGLDSSGQPSTITLSQFWGLQTNN